jgi:t-SNARE complex subunit (syntaxin)
MGDISERLGALRAVTFQYKEADEDGGKPVQFGLIAEEIAETFPELVVTDETGKPETVSYHLLSTLLLNEFQKAHSAIEDQAARIAILEAQSAELAQLKNDFAAMVAIIERLEQVRMVETTH